MWHLLLVPGIRVVFKKLYDQFQVTSNNLSKAVNVRDIERNKGILEVLNPAVSQKGYMETSQFVAYGFSVNFLFDHRALGFRRKKNCSFTKMTLVQLKMKVTHLQPYVVCSFLEICHLFPYVTQKCSG